jgi:hypothetical protein
MAKGGETLRTNPVEIENLIDQIAPFRQMCLTMDGMSIFIVKHICRRDTVQRMTGSTALSDMSA